MLAIVGLVLVVAVVVVIATDPFGGSGKSTGGVVDNASAVSLATVKRQSLSQQTQVSGTLGYAGSSSIRVPSGTAPTAVQQSSQQVTSAETMLASARATLASDTQALAVHQATLDGGAREGAGRLRGRGRRGSGIRQLLARKRKQLAEWWRERVLERRAGRLCGPAERHQHRREGHRRPLPGLLGRKTARERAVQLVHGALLGRALRAELHVHGAAVGR